MADSSQPAFTINAQFVMEDDDSVGEPQRLAIAADQVHPTRNDEALSSVALWVGVVMILSFWAVFLLLSSLFVYKVAAERTYAIQNRLQLRSESRATAPPSNV
ncbi:hypothetical protein B0T26DRAFT_680509 [Lasiosphaeria miniovina]|uniref:Uncharacterized protein n=1 Tax=Lasiosphaeria miniovina TaxID=1954250 RepID=A0AA40A0A1_9PEZI|nr:uncharacterized protein B0T26DRAFT_680509 [Lasiosphaeria miniovina]KAK0706900.1 hypothetical protein B0T26DRAFT_680509 [Lasiosphaeria miniovina]